MKPLQNWDMINEAGEFKRLPAGIYGVKITSVKDNPENEYLEVTCDITKGEYAGYFKALVDSGLGDQSRSIRSYKEKALPFFKGFITAIEKTNPGYHWNWDESTLVGKNVMAVFGEEEYLDKNNEVKVAIKLVEFRSYEAFKEGKIKVPELKKLPANSIPPKQAEIFDSIPGVTPIDTNNFISDDDLPF